MVNTVTAGESLRSELLDALYGADAPAKRAAVAVEMAMFYGRAFEKTYDACVALRTPSPLAASVIDECVFGLAVYRLWLVTVTDLDPQHEMARMAGYWRRVTGMVLGGDE